MPDEPKAKTDEGTEEEATEEESQEWEFDEESHKRFVDNTRDEAKKLKDKLAAQDEELAEFRKAKEEAEEAEKTEVEKLQGKLDKRDARIAELEGQIAAGAVERSFMAEAGSRGYEDLALAYVAAKEAGLLGTFDPKTGEVGSHDFDKLEDRYPALGGEAEERRGREAGDAGRRPRRTKKSVAGQFNDSVRRAL